MEFGGILLLLLRMARIQPEKFTYNIQTSLLDFTASIRLLS
jgi:hypothetical protein